MDVYSVFSSSAAKRDSSRLDLDLNSVRRPAGAGAGADEGAGAGAGAGARADREPRDDPCDPRGPHSMPPPHVGIVGAGIAGLRCADVLLQHGFRVTVLEGRRRLGGRLHQVRMPAAGSGGGGPPPPLVDMGPNWIHGTKDNPILDLVRATGTVTGGHDVDEDGRALAGAVFDGADRLLPLAEGEAVSTAMWQVVEKALVHSHRHGSAIDPGASLYDFFVQELGAGELGAGELGELGELGVGELGVGELGAKGSADDLRLDARTRDLVLQMADSWGAFVGSPITRQSLRFFWLEECIEGENLFCAGTYQRVLDRLAQPVVRGAAVHYGETVTRIEGRRPRPEDGRDSQSQTQSPGGLRVQTAQGREYVFDEVVCTAPLGWLQKHAAAAFVPPLPPRLTQAIAHIGYGSLEKVYLSFPEAFWQRPDPQTGRVVRGFCQWLVGPRDAAAAVDAADTPPRYTQEAFDMAALPASVAHPTLLFYLFGPQSAYVMGKLAALRADEEAEAATGAEGLAEAGGEMWETGSETWAPNARQTRFLVDHFRPYFSTLPNYDPDAPACQPTACLATNWLHDDLAGNGSYSNFQVGLRAGDDDIRVMRAGLPDRGLWLAGEHTAPFVALGTATGAYWSGESVGRRLAEAYHRGPAAAATAASTGEGIDKLHLDASLADNCAESRAENLGHLGTMAEGLTTAADGTRGR